MRTLALSLAAALFGTGCIVTTDCDRRSITVDWVSFQFADGRTTTSCAVAGVAFVDVFIDGQPVVANGFVCSDGGATIVDVARGARLVTVEGVAADGRILYRDERTISTDACGDVLASFFPAEGVVDLRYAFSPDDVCFANPSYIWFSVFDRILNQTVVQIDATSSTLDKTRYVCASEVNAPVFTLPAGVYDLDWIEERVPTATPGVFAVTARNCTRNSFDVNGGTLTNVPVTLTDATAPCVP
jgi:hypothetical protein